MTMALPIFIIAMVDTFPLFCKEKWKVRFTEQRKCVYCLLPVEKVILQMCIQSLINRMLVMKNTFECVTLHFPANLKVLLSS